MDRQCSFIKPNGGRCKLAASGEHGFCWNHAPENAGKRQRIAASGGRLRGNAEIRALKDELKTLKDDVLAGNADRNDAAVAVRIFSALKDFIELERRVKETDEIAAELEELKREYGAA